ncbi:MAG: AMP-binding protein [Candidatus Helarchaeota archaeon]|nr:AMP-binding protein [Candidatus Helarchaeota archaeon]
MNSEMDEECPMNVKEGLGKHDAPSPWVRPDRMWFKNYPEKMPKTIKYETLEKLNGLFCILKLTAINFPNNVAVYYKSKEEKYTYRELLYYSLKIARALQDLGIKKGDPVALMSTNCPEFIIAMWACTKIGAILVPINPLLKKKEVSHILRDCGDVKVAIVHEKIFNLFKRSSKEFEIKKLILIRKDKEEEGERKGIPGVELIFFHELFKKYEPLEEKIPIKMKEDIFSLLYTGGTTGLPKGVTLSHFNVISNINQLVHFNDEDFEESIEETLGKISFIAVLPLCHSFGVISVLTYTVAATQLIVYDSLDIPGILEAIEMYKVEAFSGVPTIYIMLANHPDFKKRDLTSLENAISAGAALAPAIAKQWVEVAGVEVRQGYGLTECSPATHLQPARWTKWVPHSIGIPLIDTDVKIVDPDTLEEFEPGQEGEFLIRGPQVMKGYWKKPEANQRVLIKDKEGKIWLRTGDIGYMDENGYFYISGRTKEMIKYKGYRILPAEIEAGLYEHPAVLEAGVIGVPDELVGEQIKAFIKLRPEYKETTAEEIIEWAKGKMAGYKWPRQIEFVGSIPKTPVGKIMRRALREKELKKQKS